MKYFVCVITSQSLRISVFLFFILWMPLLLVAMEEEHRAATRRIVEADLEQLNLDQRFYALRQRSEREVDLACNNMSRAVKFFTIGAVCFLAEKLTSLSHGNDNINCYQQEPNCDDLKNEERMQFNKASISMVITGCIFFGDGLRRALNSGTLALRAEKIAQMDPTYRRIKHKIATDSQYREQFRALQEEE